MIDKVVIVGDSRIAEVFGEDADPRNGIACQITEICPAQVIIYAAGGQRMSRWHGQAYKVNYLSFFDAKDGAMYMAGAFGGIQALVIMLDYND